MPAALNNFRARMSYKEMEIPTDSVEFRNQFLQFWKSLRPTWQFVESTTIKNTEGALFNDQNFLPEDETWTRLMVSGSHGILLALVGAAMWAISAKQDKKRKGTGEGLTKMIKDINVVIRMMSQHILNERENNVGQSQKRHEVVSDDEHSERNAKRARTRKRRERN